MSPSELPDSADVVVIGAGLAGLNASLDLQAAGLRPLVLEARQHVGGRVATTVADGFRLDHGFQLYNPSYPAGRAVFDYQALDLRAFTRGAYVSTSKGRWLLADPRGVPTAAISGATSRIGSVRSKLRFAWYATTCARSSPSQLRDRPDISTYRALRDAGVSERFIDGFVGPFLSGVFLEADLTTSRRFLDLVLRSFVRGTPSVPATGMAALPRQLAQRLPRESVITDCPVTKLSGEAGAIVVETSQGRVTSRAAIVAVDPTSVSSLVPGFARPRMNAVTTWYHATSQPREAFTQGRGAIVVDGSHRGLLVNSVAISTAAPSYAPPGQVLISSSALGSHESKEDDEHARKHAGLLHEVSPEDWRQVAKFVIPNALPAKPAPLDLRADVRLGAGRYVAGDHRDTPSIQGALVSGRRSAAAVIADLMVS